MDYNPDQLLITNPAGVIGVVPALPCLFFGLPSLTVATWSIATGRLFQNWPTILVGLVIGIPMTYLGIGFLTYAKCTLLDRAARGGVHWIRLIHRWQPETFELKANARISVWQPKRGTSSVRRHRAMLKTSKEAVKIYESTKREKVLEQAKKAGLFLGIPVVEE